MGSYPRKVTRSVTSWGVSVGGQTRCYRCNFLGGVLAWGLAQGQRGGGGPPTSRRSVPSLGAAQCGPGGPAESAHQETLRFLLSRSDTVPTQRWCHTDIWTGSTPQPHVFPPLPVEEASLGKLVAGAVAVSHVPKGWLKARTSTLQLWGASNMDGEGETPVGPWVLRTPAC